MGENGQEPGFLRLMLGVHIGAMFPVAVFAVIYYPLSAYVILLGVPLALSAVWFFILPLLAFIAFRWGLRLWHFLATGALAASGPILLLHSKLIFASITGQPAKTGLLNSYARHQWTVRNGMLTEDGWRELILEPVLALSLLGVLGAMIALWIGYGTLCSKQ